MVVKNDEKDENVLNATTKIFFCSRTHSQLAQFVNEVRRVKIPIEDELNASSEADAKQTESIRLISLGARKNLCVNPSVIKLGNATAINEKCLELQQPKTSKDQKCKFLPNKENEVLITQFRDLALATIRDIEDLSKIGKETGICPYYASRATIGPSEIVTLPYPLLLQKSAREALDISLKGHVVIIDEAHNLVNSIEGVYSAEVSLHQLQQSRSQLLVYLQKFRNRLKGKNRVYVAQVVRLIDSLVTYLQDKQSKNLKGGLVEMTELMSGKGLDQVNLHKLCRYLQESKLARKVAGYVTSQSGGNPDTTAPTPRNEENPVLMTVEALFHTLTNPAGEGKFFYEQSENGYVLRYMLLDPAHHFRDVVEEARSVVLAGGTMSPMEDYINYLFPYSDTSSIRMISCGHVIPKENLLAFPLTATGKTVLDFTFDKRGSLMVIKELGQTVLSLANTIPDGLVVFFPSYQYLDQVIRCWSKESLHSTPAGPSILNELQVIKPVFQEHKGVNVDSLLTEYASAIDSNRGGLLLSVIGGKLSEGINFSDRLGRGVAVVGLPFPNSQSVEWKTKLNYIEHSVIARGGSSKEGKATAQEYYENACMRAVNQSVGRAIRHKGDYACIALLDRRYATARIQAKLPGWIKSGLIQGGEEHSLSTLLRKVHGFFADHELKGRTA